MRTCVCVEGGRRKKGEERPREGESRYIEAAAAAASWALLMLLCSAKSESRVGVASSSATSNSCFASNWKEEEEKEGGRDDVLLYSFAPLQCVCAPTHTTRIALSLKVSRSEKKVAALRSCRRGREGERETIKWNFKSPEIDDDATCTRATRAHGQPNV